MYHYMKMHDQNTCIIQVPNCHVSNVLWEIDDMLADSIFTTVTEPADWVSSVAYSWNTNDNACVCLNHNHLNTAIHQHHHCITTVEKFTHALFGSIMFMKLNRKSVYHFIALDDERSYITMFNMPLDHFGYLWVPFWITSAHDILLNWGT